MKPKKEASIDTLALTESLGLKTHRRECRKTWSKEEDQRLLDRLNAFYPHQMASKTLNAREVDWDTISAVFSGRRKANDCKKRWTTSLNPHLRRGKWTEEEDRHLVEMYNKYGALWQQVASHIAGRTEHQCSKRYFEVLDPSVANRLQPWSETEDLRLIDLVEQYGTKWRTIAQNLESRPPLTCRNRWRNLLTSVVRERASAPIMSRMSEVAGVIKEENPGDGPRPDNNSDKSPNSATSDTGNVEPSYPETRPSPASFTESGASSASISARPPLSQLLQQKSRNSVHSEPKMAPPALYHSGRNSESELLASVRTSARLPATTEWSYALSPLNSSSGRYPEMENGQGLEFGTPKGFIGSMHLVEALISHAARHNVKIELHQHHYYRNEYLPMHDHQTSQPSPQSSHSFSGSDHGSERKLPQLYNLGPDVHVTRFQHFNYLPPSTPLPQLQSSSNSPDGHRVPVSRESSTESGKESDLRRLLNAQEPYTGNTDSDDQMGTSVRRRTSADISAAPKRQRMAPNPEPDEGLDFFESIRTLHKQDPGGPADEGTKNHSHVNFLPVSQHHPLHSTGDTPGPEDWGIDEDDEDFMSAFGLYAHMRDKPLEPQMTIDDADEFFPFNPS